MRIAGVQWCFGYICANVGELAAAAFNHIEKSWRQSGPYRIRDLLGRSGMGAVYWAERVNGEVTWELAVKLLQLGADSPTIRKRFLAERQIMASLNHPGIAALLDAGHTRHAAAISSDGLHRRGPD